ncbi:peptidase domain-containing ABC transporter [Brevundimonas sp. 2R-24]|uniref:Peptidase domain-containing ABC transporter n=1 Tax=Peiella sedimenti TaxID=3061083 RepID=A0ABT8SQ88_9CAUL|nr:peptidase domain-containing ABC transporter [Caulobacteraceae bacterium XZ-24]
MSTKRRSKVPFFRATEGSECGLACLAMVLAHHDGRSTLSALRQRFQTSLAGVNLKGLMEVASASGLAPRAYRAEIDELSVVRLPAILHWDFNHFVVLSHIDRHHVEILDPAVGRRRIRRTELSAHFTGVVLELEPTSSVTLCAPTPRVRLSTLWKDAGPLRAALFQVLAFSAALGCVSFVLPLQMQFIIDQAVEPGIVSLLPLIAGVFLLLAGLQLMIEFVRAWIIQYYASHLSYEAAGNVFRHLVRLPITFFEGRRMGDIASRFQGVSQINEIILSGAVAALIDTVVALLALAILFHYSVWLGLITLVSTAVAGGVTWALQGRINALVDASISDRSHEQSILFETLRSILPIKLNAREAERETLWRNQLAQALASAFSLARFRTLQSQAGAGISSASTVLLMAAGAYLVINDELTLGMLLAAFVYRGLASEKLLRLLTTYGQLQMVKVLLERLSEIVSTPAEATEVAALTEPIGGDIRLVDVSFRYGATDRPVLKGVNLHIPSGDYVAITGPSGSGKSTLLKLILGLYTPSSGHVELDGAVASPELWRAWRRSIGLVTQEDHLAAGSIADNINFFSPDVNRERLHRAAQTAQVHDEIMAMPMNYQSLIGELGAALSSGQKQRILLARAFYNDPALLVFDEGTANLDASNEDRIADIVAGLNITRIVVSHRPALVRRAKRVFEVRGGDVCEVQLPSSRIAQNIA